MSNKTKAQLELELQASQARVAKLERALKQAQAQASADESPGEEKLRQLLETLPVGISILDDERKVVFQNSALSQILQLSPSDLQSGTYKKRRYLAADGNPMPADGFASAQAEKSGSAVYDVATGIVKENNGEVIWTNVSAVPIDLSGWRTVIVTTDITKRKRMETDHVRLTERFNLAARAAGIGIWDWDIQKKQIVWDDQMYALYGITANQFGGAYEAWLNGVHPDDREASNAVSAAAMRGERDYDTEFRVLWRDGSVHWLKANGQVFRDEQGAPLRMVGVNYDITARKQLENDLRESEQKYTLLFEKSAIPIFLIKLPEVAIAAANEAAEKLTGFDREEMLGRNAAQLGLISAQKRAETISRFEKEQTLAENEMHLTTKTGDERMIVINTNPLVINGQPFAITSMLDITERKRMERLLQENERKYRDLVQNANSAIIHWKSDGTIVFFNEFAQAFFGYHLDEILGKPVGILVPQTDSAGGDLSMLVQSIVEHPDQFMNVVNENVCSDGRRVWMAWTNKPIYDEQGQAAEILAVGVDITDRKRMEDELRRSNAELEQFAYVASHDLQEPLRTVAGMVQLLQQRYQGRLDGRADEYIRFAVDASDRMQQLINDLLDFSRVERKGRSFAATDMEQVLRAALANLQTAIAANGARITHDPLPTIMADAGQLTQTLQNLIGNAIKFRGAQPPEVHVSAEKMERVWQFAVRDNGIGIEPQYFERVFLLFQRLHVRSKYPGTGIGLALCKKIIERHGGKMWVQSELNRGATFYFTIPEDKRDIV